MEDIFAVLAAVREQTSKRGTKGAPPTAGEFGVVDMKRLMMLPAVRNALFTITAFNH